MNLAPIRRLRRLTDGVRSAADAPGRVKALWAAEAALLLAAGIAAWHAAPNPAQLVDLARMPPWPGLATGAPTGAAIAAGLLAKLGHAAQATQRWLIDRAERSHRLDIDDEDIEDDNTGTQDATDSGGWGESA